MDQESFKQHLKLFLGVHLLRLRKARDNNKITGIDFFMTRARLYNEWSKLAVLVRDPDYYSRSQLHRELNLLSARHRRPITDTFVSQWIDGEIDDSAMLDQIRRRIEDSSTICDVCEDRTL